MPERNDDDVGLRDLAADGWFNSKTGELAPGFKIERRETLLDVGCGEGLFSHFCAQQGAHLLLADIDAEKLRSVSDRLRGFGEEAFQLLLTDANPLPLSDCSVDKVIASEVLEHVADPDRFVDELVRVAKPGALFLISVPGALSETLQKDLAPEAYFLPPNHIRIFQPGELASLLRRHGLVVEREISRGFSTTMWWTLFWSCNQAARPPWHPLLKSWNHTWALLLDQPEGLKVKRTLDRFLPKSVAIIARKACPPD